MRWSLRWLGLAVAAGVAACGGGGGGADAPAAQPVQAPPVLPASTNAAAAWANLLTSSRTYSLNATGPDGKAYTLSYSIAPTGSGTFNSVTGRTTQFTSTLKSAGVLISTSTTTLYFGSDSQVVYGAARGTEACFIFTGGAPAPSATVGQVGPLYEGQGYTCSGVRLSLFESQVTTWGVEAEGSTVYFCANTVTKLAVTSPVSQLCAQVNPQGAIGNVARVTLTDGNKNTLVFR